MKMQSDNAKTSHGPAEESDWVWGMSAIAREINRTTEEAYYLHRKGVLPVRKFGHRTIAASRRRLRELVLE
jgi:hypothetical protein